MAIKRSTWKLMDEYFAKTAAMERYVVYIIGPISSVKDDLTRWLNYAARVQTHLVRDGYVVINPYGSGFCSEAWETDYAAWLAHGFNIVGLLAEQGLIVALDGWEKSEGATAEYNAAQNSGVPCYAARLLQDEEGVSSLELIPILKDGEA